jgi:CheY-like chemotaxis protein
MNDHRRVLVVEDDEDVREAIQEALEEEGYAVSSAANGAVALDALRASEELPSLILLDLMMPVMDGERFLRELRGDARLQGLPVVIVTADGRAHAKASVLGAQEGLKKPVRMGDLLSTVSRYCAGG